MCCLYVCFYLSSFKWRICFVVLYWQSVWVNVNERVYKCVNHYWENDFPYFFHFFLWMSVFFLFFFFVQILFIQMPCTSSLCLSASLVETYPVPYFFIATFVSWTWSILVCYCCQCSARYSWALCSLWYPTHSLLGRESTHILHEISNF